MLERRGGLLEASHAFEDLTRFTVLVAAQVDGREQGVVGVGAHPVGLSLGVGDDLVRCLRGLVVALSGRCPLLVGSAELLAELGHGLDVLKDLAGGLLGLGNDRLGTRGGLGEELLGLLGGGGDRRGMGARIPSVVLGADADGGGRGGGIGADLRGLGLRTGDHLLGGLMCGPQHGGHVVADVVERPLCAAVADRRSVGVRHLLEERPDLIGVVPLEPDRELPVLHRLRCHRHASASLAVAAVGRLAHPVGCECMPPRSVVKRKIRGRAAAIRG